jgi:Protein of unknown function (DUF2877)
VNTSSLQKIPGFEKTDYAYLHGKIVWCGEQAATDHPRNTLTPWQPEKIFFNANKLYQGANICRKLIKKDSDIGNKNEGYRNNLLIWLVGEELSFPLNLSANRFDAVNAALLANDLETFKTAALRVLGLGNGLTPSGDDFIGGIFFALAHAPRPSWIEKLPAVKLQIHNAAKASTNVISAALLDDMMAGCSYSVLHDVLIALHSKDENTISTACQKLLMLGASSGADMLAGLLVALTTQNKPQIH